MNTNTEKIRGSSLLEIILACALFLVFSSALLGTFFDVLALGRADEEQERADLIAREGYEEVRVIRKQGFQSLPMIENKGTFWNGSSLQFVDDPNVFGKYIRTITIRPARRDEDGKLTNEGGSEDNRAVEVQSSVSWVSARGETLSTVYRGYLVFWEENF